MFFCKKFLITILLLTMFFPPNIVLAAVEAGTENLSMTNNLTLTEINPSTTELETVNSTQTENNNFVDENLVNENINQPENNVNTEESNSTETNSTENSTQIEDQTDPIDPSTLLEEPEPDPVITPKQEIKLDAWKNIKGFNDFAGYDLFTGEFRFSIPISVPQGRNTLTPNISVNYSSLNKNLLTTAGYGFELSFGAIYRVNSRGTDNLYSAENDNEFAVKLFDNYEEIIYVDDAVNLNNENEKIYIDKSGWSFNKYYFNSQTKSWRMEDTFGNTYYFGTNTNLHENKDNSTRQFSPIDLEKIFLWALETQTDSLGDKIEYEYSYDTTNNQIYLAKIKYGFYDNPNNSTEQINLYQIDFNYIDKLTSPTSYLTAFKIGHCP